MQRILIAISVVATSFLISSPAAGIDLRNDPMFVGATTSLREGRTDNDPDGIPFRIDFDLSGTENAESGAVENLKQVGAGQAVLVLSSVHFWDWFHSVDDLFEGNVPPEMQPWLDPGPHEVTFVVSDESGESVYGQFTVDLTQDERESPGPFEWGPWWEEHEAWRDFASFGGHGGEFEGLSNVLVALDEPALAEINAALAEPSGTWSIRIDAPGQSIWDQTTGIAPGRPTTPEFGGGLVLAPAEIPEPATWLIAVVSAIALGVGLNAKPQRRKDARAA